MLSPFLFSPQKDPYPLPLHLLPNLPTPTSWPRHAPILRNRTFTINRACPAIDNHPLLHIQVEPCVPICVFFDRCLSPREFWQYWLVHIVAPPTRLQIPSAPWVLSLATSLGTLCFIQWMAEYPLLYLSDTNRAYQETTLLGSCQHALGICNSV